MPNQNAQLLIILKGILVLAVGAMFVIYTNLIGPPGIYTCVTGINPVLYTTITGINSFPLDEEVVLEISVIDFDSSNTLADATVSVSLAPAPTNQPTKVGLIYPLPDNQTTLFTGQTGPDGKVLAVFQIPPNLRGLHYLLIETDYQNRLNYLVERTMIADHPDTPLHPDQPLILDTRYRTRGNFFIPTHRYHQPFQYMRAEKSI